ncbi:MAG: hypothetical protein JWN44_6156 [Myxococcales bacterium]|nr:hypothetical protein [Myxococcales bacterium]
MKSLLLSITLLASGCLGTLIPGPQPHDDTADMAGATGTGGNGSGSGTGSGNGSGTGGGMSTDMATLASGDLAGVMPTGTALFGATCITDGPAGECASGMCKQFVGGTIHRCTKACTVATQTADCAAPSDGTCTNNGYCKFIQ